jgi:hypothetical protein
MNPIKDKFGLSTDKGNDFKSAIWMAMATIVTMPDTHERTLLLIVAMLAMCVISYLTVGHMADPEYIETQKELKDVLGEGRDG